MYLRQADIPVLGQVDRPKNDTLRPAKGPLEHRVTFFFLVENKGKGLIRLEL